MNKDSRKEVYMSKQFIATFILYAAIFFTIGYTVGTCTRDEEVQEKESVSIKPSSVFIHDTIYYPEPYVEYHVRTILDTLREYVIDTSRVVDDYYATRKYNLDFSNDSLGVFKFDLTVNQNKLCNVVSNIHPYERVVTREIVKQKVKLMQIYVIGGTSPNFKTQRLGVGLDINQSYLLGISGMRYNDNYNYTIDFGIKF